MLRKLFRLIFPCAFREKECEENMLGCKCGKGKSEPAPPVYKEDPATTALKNKLMGQVSGLLDVPYSEYESRFTPSNRVQDYLSGITDKYSGLIESQDYGIADFAQTEKNYLDSILGQYGRAREEAYKPLQESLIAEGLFGSGPGYEIMSKYGQETAQGVSDITAGWAREGINRQLQQQQYKDALKRGDYTTMFNLALMEAEQEVAPAKAATQAQLAGINPALGLFGNMTQADLSRAQLEQAAYETQLANYYKSKKNLGGIGSAAGMGIGYLMGGPIGGIIGGEAGGSLGSMIEY